MRILSYLFLGVLLSLLMGAQPPARAEANSITRQAELQIIPELDKGHHDKLQLAFYVRDIRHGSSNADLDAFCADMKTQQQHLREQLKSWAKSQNVSTNFQYGSDIMDAVRKRMEDDEGKQLQNAKNDAFKLAVLTDMQQDYTYQISLIKTLRDIRGIDGQLKAYLDDSLTVHDQGLQRITELLKRFHFQ